ncbi:glycoside hydrolase family 76 protein [Niabella aurantiaca]|uniref:glycoside hydrolase family 76 protein n=1 Tax=Niabella aurantiaca TaxID=379900 RepID=UPI001FDFABC5|nr:glycoside hydrolase family 76 protein [Niabella aurantiaca]
MKPAYRLLFFLLMLLAMANSGRAQGPDYAKEYRLLKEQILRQYYNPRLNYYREHAPARADDRPSSYLWPLCALLEAYQAGEPDAKDFEQTFGIIRKYYDQRQPAAGYASFPPELGGGSRFYDDNQWIGIAVMHQYEKTGDQRWLHHGEEIYRFMMSGFDTVSGGGLYWEEGKKTTKNTCSNGPGILLALQLYRATADSMYLKTATGLYQWVNSRLRTPEGLYYDNLNLKDNHVDKRIYSYNAGTMLEANVLFYKLTGEGAYLKEAQKIAAAADRRFFEKGQFHDNYWFNAVLLRGFQQLWAYDKNTAWLDGFRKAVDHAVAHKNDQGLFGKNGKAQNLVPQGGMLEILGRMARLQKQGALK